MSRRSTITLVFIGGSIWLFIVTLGLSRLQTNIEDLFPWLPTNDPQVAEYEEFLERFGCDDILLVSWDGISLDDPRIPQLKKVLEADQSSQGASYISRVVTAPKLIHDLQVKPFELSRKEAIDRLKPILVGENEETTCLIVSLTPDGMRARRQVVESIIQSCDAFPEISQNLRLGGRPYLGFFSSQNVRRSIVTLSIPVAILSTLLAWICLRRLDLMLIVLCSSGATAITSLAMVPLFGMKLNGLLTALPSFAYVIHTSAMIHLVNYAVGLQRDQPSLSTLQLRQCLLQKAWRPCVLSSASTALGTFSLMVSRFPAILEFGLFATLGIIISFSIQLGLVPSILSHVVRRHPPHEERMLHQMLRRLIQPVVRYQTMIIAGTVLFTLLLIKPITDLDGQFDVDAIYDDSTEFVQNIQWFEKNLGPLDTTEVVIELKATQDNYFLKRLDQIREIDRELAKIPTIASTYSAASMIPEVHGVFNRILARRAIGKHRHRVVDSAYLAEENGKEYWRINLRTSFFAQADRETLRAEVAKAIQLATSEWKEVPNFKVTGSSQLVHETQDDVLRDFTMSIGFAYLMIGLLMMCALRSVGAGLCAMAPNVIPCITVFGVLGALDGKIDLGMTVAACIALGIAVDDTSHLLMRYRDAQRTTTNKLKAFSLAFDECALAMVQTSIICGISMTPYLFASLIYLQRFGMVIPLLMAAALLGDLIFLPAIIVSRLGKVFHLPNKAK